MSLFEKRILIIDDEPKWADIFKEGLCDQGYKCVDVKYGVSKFVDLLEYDLAIVDIKMPNFDGFKVKEYLITNSPETKIILISQHEDFGIDLLDDANGAHGWLKKKKILEENKWDLLMLVNDILGEKDQIKEKKRDYSSNDKINININIVNDAGIRTADQIELEEIYQKLRKEIDSNDFKNKKDIALSIDQVGLEFSKKKKNLSFIIDSLTKIKNTAGNIYRIGAYIDKMIGLIEKIPSI